MSKKKKAVISEEIKAVMSYELKDKIQRMEKQNSGDSIRDEL